MQSPDKENAFYARCKCLKVPTSHVITQTMYPDTEIASKLSVKWYILVLRWMGGYNAWG